MAYSDRDWDEVNVALGHARFRVAELAESRGYADQSDIFRAIYDLDLVSDLFGESIDNNDKMSVAELRSACALLFFLTQALGHLASGAGGKAGVLREEMLLAAYETMNDIEVALYELR